MCNLPSVRTSILEIQLRHSLHIGLYLDKITNLVRLSWKTTYAYSFQFSEEKIVKFLKTQWPKFWIPDFVFKPENLKTKKHYKPALVLTASLQVCNREILAFLACTWARFWYCVHCITLWIQRNTRRRTCRLADCNSFTYTTGER